MRREEAPLAGSIVHHSGFNAGFLILGAAALSAFGAFSFFMPETFDNRSPNPTV